MECSKAPGKIILFGEHFVVAGKPAIGLAVSKYAVVCVGPGSGNVYSSRLGKLSPDQRHSLLYVAVFRAFEELTGIKPSLDVYVESEIPVGAGMGSSAAIAVALAHAMLRYHGITASKELVLKLAHEGEKSVHYRPSGVDATLATYGGFLYYRQGEFRRLDLALPRGYSIVVVNTGVERSTGTVVREVLERYSRLQRVGQYIYQAAEEIVEQAVNALKSGDASALGELMVVNHGLLWSMGASSRICDEIVYELIDMGARGAKLSGAGRGGIVIGLVESSRALPVVRALAEKGFEAFAVSPDYEGVRETQPINPGRKNY